MYKCNDCQKKYVIKPDYCDSGSNIFIEEKTYKTELLSIIILVGCIILAFLILLFAGKPNINPNILPEKKPQVQEIPSIETIWKEKEPVKIEKEKNNPKKSLPDSKKVKPSEYKNIKTSQTTETKKEKDPIVIQTPTPEQLKKELLSYKIALRNKIAYDIDFASVIGDGECTVEFKIDSSGNLIERKFSQQSTNDSLNDAVFSAILKTPVYNNPPTMYKNEVLNFNVKMYGGNFEVELN